MRGISAIIKKEFARFFLDKRMILTTLILPGLLIYLVYTIIGSIFTDMSGGANIYSIAVRNLPSAMTPLTQLEELNVTSAEDDDQEYILQVEKGELDLYVIFPENFEDIITDYANQNFSEPDVQIYYNSSEDSSSAAYTVFTALLDEIYSIFTVNGNTQIKYDLADDVSTAGKVLGAIVPMVLLVMLFSGCMSVAPESIAGEKERGTFATMLVTPVKRSHIAVGKIVSLSCIALLSGICSFIGLILSLPKLLKWLFEGVSLSMFGFGHYAMALGIMLSTVLLLVALISCVSSLAKSVKEANSYVGPLNILVLVAGLIPNFVGGAVSPFMYLIPVYNSAMLITDIITLSVAPLNFIITLFSNLLYACALVFILTRMFRSEKIMFNR